MPVVRRRYRRYCTSALCATYVLKCHTDLLAHAAEAFWFWWHDESYAEFGSRICASCFASRRISALNPATKIHAIPCPPAGRLLVVKIEREREREREREKSTWLKASTLKIALSGKLDLEWKPSFSFYSNQLESKFLYLNHRKDLIKPHLTVEDTSIHWIQFK